MHDRCVTDFAPIRTIALRRTTVTPARDLIRTLGQVVHGVYVS